MRLAACLLVLLLAGCTSTLPASVSNPSSENRLEPGVPSSVASLPKTDAAVSFDATLTGPLTWTKLEYDLGLFIVNDPTMGPYQYPLPVNGSLTMPVGTSPAPVVLLLHGRHGTCSVAGFGAFGTGYCPNAVVVEPINSYEGYDYLAQNLASHGYAVVSVNANTINDRDLLGDSGANARAQLVLRTLDELTSINATGTSLPDATGLPLPRTDLSQFKGRFDLSRIGLMGHSRGGEGVTRAITLNQARPQPYSLSAVFALAPTDFARWKTPGVAFAVLLPYCDGDVSDLQGAKIYDDSRGLDDKPRFQVVTMGANHNYYNALWTGDDWGTRGDDYCDKAGRDSPEAQRLHGLDLMASFFRLFVGGESAFTPTWYAGQVPDSLCPDKQGPCPDRFQISLQLGGASAHVAAMNGLPTSLDGITAVPCDPDRDRCPSDFTVGAAAQTVLEGKGIAYYALPGNSSGLRIASARFGVPTSSGDASGRLEVTCDGATNGTDLRLASPPGGPNARKTVLSMVSVPLPASCLHGEISIRLDKGQLQVADVQAQA